MAMHQIKHLAQPGDKIGKSGLQEVLGLKKKKPAAVEKKPAAVEKKPAAVEKKPAASKSKP